MKNNEPKISNHFETSQIFLKIKHTVDIQRHSEGIEKAFLPMSGNFL